MPPSSLTLNYDAVLSTTLFNYQKTLEDQISSGNRFFYAVKKSGGWSGVSDLGDRIAIPLMYELGTADSYSGYDQLDVTPMDGISTAFFDWRQAAVPIAISGLEEKKNRGSESKLIDLLEAKTEQAVMGIQEFFAKGVLQGNRGSAITTAYTSGTNGSVFVDPLPLLVKYDPTTSTTIGNINQSTYSWWQNQTANSTSSTYAGFLKELRNLFNDCSKGPGGVPNFHIVDQSTFELYESALAASHRNPSYQKADIPFDNILFKGQPVVWDEFVPDVQGGSVTQSTTSGTWWMLNTKFIKVKYDKSTNFTSTPFQKPENQDAKVAHILWLGAVCVSNRRKHGVMGGIDTTIAA